MFHHQFLDINLTTYIWRTSHPDYYSTRIILIKQNDSSKFLVYIIYSFLIFDEEVRF